MKNFVRLISIGLLLIMSVCFASCANGDNPSESTEATSAKITQFSTEVPTEAPTQPPATEDIKNVALKTVEVLFLSLKDKNFDVTHKCLGVYSEGAENSEQLQNSEIINAMLDKMTYSIGDAEIIDEQTVNVNVSVTNVDMKTAVANYLKEAMSIAMQNAFSNEPLPDNQLQQELDGILIDCINSNETGTVTIDAIATVKKADDGWNVQLNTSLANAIFGGLGDTLESLNSSFGSNVG